MAKRADDLRAMRLAKRLTQNDVATKLKVSQGYYSAIERGAKPTDVRDAEKVVSRMRTRTDRTSGGTKKTGRLK